MAALASNFESLIQDGLEQKLAHHAALEQTGSQIYLAASFFFEQKNFKGIAKYLQKDSDNERGHALEFYSYIHKRGGEVLPAAIPELEQEILKTWNIEKASSVFNSLLDLELKVEESINGLMNIAHEQKDHATAAFLQKFVEIQVEEIDEMRELVEKTKAYEAMPGLLYHLDKELS